MPEALAIAERLALMNADMVRGLIDTRHRLCQLETLFSILAGPTRFDDAIIDRHEFDVLESTNASSMEDLRELLSDDVALLRSFTAGALC